MKATDEQIAVVEKMDDDDDFEPEPCEWCGQFLCRCEDIAFCKCRAYTADGYQIADCVCQ